jgi:hypothetical protein
MKKAFVWLALGVAMALGGCSTSTYRDSGTGASGTQGSAADDFFHANDEAKTHVSD